MKVVLIIVVVVVVVMVGWRGIFFSVLISERAKIRPVFTP